jgi:hypothetical protein
MNGNSCELKWWQRGVATWRPGTPTPILVYLARCQAGRHTLALG